MGSLSVEVRTEVLCGRICDLEAENAKLRELIADVHEALRADKAGVFHGLILASMEDDMRELGIEVTP